MNRALSEPDLVEAYRSTVRPLYAYVSRRVGGDIGLAQDLVQDTWMRAMGRLAGEGHSGEPLARLIRVARNTLISHFRRQRPQLIEPLCSTASKSSRRWRPMIRAQRRSSTGDSRGSGARTRELLEDFYFADKSVRDIARERSLSERAVEGRLRRAREKLKQKIERVLPRAATRAREADGGTNHVVPRT